MSARTRNSGRTCCRMRTHPQKKNQQLNRKKGFERVEDPSQGAGAEPLPAGGPYYTEEVSP